GDVVAAGQPAAQRVVVVRRGVDDEVAPVAIGADLLRLAVAEGELEDAHAGQAEAVAQRLDVGGDDAEVLGDEVEARAELLEERAEERLPRGLHPAPAAGV